MNVKRSCDFSDELYEACGRTVESGRWLPEFWLRVSGSIVLVGQLHYKYQRFSEIPAPAIVARISGPTLLCEFVATTVECQYTCVCRALSDEFAAVNRKLSDDDAGSAPPAAAPLSEAHSRLTRLVRMFNDEYALLILLTTISLLLRQIYALNDTVFMIIDGETYGAKYMNFVCYDNTYQWIVMWLRFWWICYRVDGLIKQVSGTRDAREVGLERS